MNVPGVEGVHDIKVRLSGGWYQMEIHVVVDGDMTVRDGHAIAKEVEQCLARDVGNVNTIIVHVDPSEN
jgi:divalent metal cation (Fe/Co/Zn/Cd) transporter